MAGLYSAGVAYDSGFGIRISFGFRPSDFGFGRLAAGVTIEKRLRVPAGQGCTATSPVVLTNATLQACWPRRLWRLKTQARRLAQPKSERQQTYDNTRSLAEREE